MAIFVIIGLEGGPCALIGQRDRWGLHARFNFGYEIFFPRKAAHLPSAQRHQQRKGCEHAGTCQNKTKPASTQIHFANRPCSALLRY